MEELAIILAVLAAGGGLGSVVSIVLKMVNLLKAEKKIRSEIAEKHLEPQVEGEDPVEIIKHLQGIMGQLSKQERGAILEALTQPSKEGRERYLERLLRPRESAHPSTQVG